MKQRPAVKPLFHGTNVVSLNLLRIRRRVAIIARDMDTKPMKPQHGHLRRAAIKAKAGAYFKR